MNEAGWQYDDGGRKAAGFRGEASDCLVRAIAIAAQMPYRDVYHAVNEEAKGEKHRRGKLGFLAATGRGSSARTGVYRQTADAYLLALGWTWTPTMAIGQGCTVHLADGELPRGRIIVRVSRHWCAVIDGVIHDTHDPSRGGTRCVYGYWTAPTPEKPRP